MIYKLDKGGIVKLQNAWTTMPSVEDAILRAWANQSAKEKAEKQVASEKPKYTYVNPYDYLHGWREATEDAAKQDKYTVENLGGSKEEAEAAYNASKENAAKQLAGTTATVLPTAAAMAISMGSAGPIAAHLTNAGFTYNGIKDLTSNNGIRKTVRLINEQNYPKATKSAIGDALNLLGTTGTIRIISKLANPAYRAYHAYNTILPYSYENPFSRGKTWLKSMLSETKYNKPLWEGSDSELKMANELGLHADRTMQARSDAFAIYTGQNPKHGMYVKLPGEIKYSYNIDKFRNTVTRNPDAYLEAKYDFLGNTHGGLHDVQVHSIDPKHGTVYIKDVFDLNPFERFDDKLFSKNIYNALMKKFGTDVWRNKAQAFRKYMYDKGYWDTYSERSHGIIGKATKWLDSPLNQYRTGIKTNWTTLSDGTKVPGELTFFPEPANNIIYKLTNNKLTKHIDKKIGKMEVGPLLGGKPFTMETTFPYTIERWNTIIK